MFIAVDVNGKTYIEGQNVELWDDIPTGIILASVTLTDNCNLQETLVGFSKYVVYNVKTLSQTMSGKGQCMGSSKSPKLCGQVLEAVIDRKQDYTIIAKASREMASTLQGSDINRMTRKALTNAKTTLENKYKAASIVRIGLGFTSDYLRRTGQVSTGFREGVVTRDKTSSLESIKKELIRIMELANTKVPRG